MPLAKHCPDCGGVVVPLAECAGRCGGCSRRVYANSRPAAGVFLLRSGRLLLVRRGAEPGKGRWDIPGGFLNEGEPPEVGAVREIAEELGWRLDPARLRLVLTSVNPNPDGAVLDILFEADAPAGDPVPADDAAACAWFDINALPDDLAFDATRSALRRWRAARAAGSRRV